MKEARLLPVVPGPTHGRHGGAVDRGGASRRPGALVGSQFSLRDPLPLAWDVKLVSAVLAVSRRVVQGSGRSSLPPQPHFEKRFPAIGYNYTQRSKTSSIAL